LTDLAKRDADLAAVVSLHGAPPLWARQPGFPTLVHIILEQQVSLASAKAAFDRLEAALSGVTPEGLLSLSDEKLKTIGFSRQKTRYCRELSRAIVDGRFDLKRLPRLSDANAKESLMSLVGIGRWTADIYLLMALRRPDIWPKGDLALAKAAQQVKNLDNLPDHDQLEELAESWQPWRAVAARVLWHHYLSS
jgi:DNA-3-methyladenine glycosylase II